VKHAREKIKTLAGVVIFMVAVLSLRVCSILMMMIYEMGRKTDSNHLIEVLYSVEI